MANDIEIRVTGSNTSGSAFAAVNQSVAQAKRNAAAAWKEFDVLAVAAETAAAEIAKLDASLGLLDASSASAASRAVGDISSKAKAAVIPVASLADALDHINATSAATAARGVDVVGDESQDAAKDVDRLITSLKQLPGGAVAAAAAAAAIDGIGNQARGSTAPVAALGAAVTGLAATAPAAKAAAEAIDDIGDGAGASTMRLAGLSVAIGHAGESLRSARDKASELMAALAAAGQGDVGLLSGMWGARQQRILREADEELDRIQKRAAEGLPDETKWTRGAEALHRILGPVHERIRSIGQGISDFGTAGVKDLGRQMTEGVSQLSEALTGGLSGIMSLGPALAVSIAAAAPLIGAAASEAVLLGVGGAGLGIAIAAAFQDEQVKTSWSKLVEVGKAEFLQMGDAFRAPVAKAIDDMSRKLQNLDLAGVVRPLASAIDPLERGFTTMISRALPGVRTAASAAVEPLKRIGDDMAGLGTNISTMFKGVAVGADGASRAMSDLIGLTGVLLAQVGTVVGALGKAYEWADKFGLTALSGALGGKDKADKSKSDSGAGDKLKDATGAVADMNERLKGSAEQLVTSLSGVSVSLSEAIFKTGSFAQAFDALNGTLFASLDADMAAEQAIDNLSEALSNNGNQWDIGTQKGRDNTRAVEEAILKARDLASAKFAEGYSVEQVNGIYQSHLKQILDTAGGSANLRANIQALITKYGEVPPVVGSEVRVTGLDTATAKTYELLRQLWRIDGTVSNAQIYVQLHADDVREANRILNPRALGGPVRKGEAYLVGERRPELFVPTENGTIIPQVPPTSTPTPWGGGAAASGGVTFAPVFNIQTLDPRGAATAVMDAIGEWERTNGSGWRS